MVVQENKLTYDEFFDKFIPVHNFHVKDAPFDGHMYETYGTELEHVKRHLDNVWTIIDSEGQLYVSPGYHFVNRFGYFITEKPTDFSVVDILIDDD